MRSLGSYFMRAADSCKGARRQALAVDREALSIQISDEILNNPHIQLVEKRIEGLDDSFLDGFDKIIVAAGPMASENLSNDIARHTGGENCYFMMPLRQLSGRNPLICPLFSGHRDMAGIIWMKRVII